MATPSQLCPHEAGDRDYAGHPEDEGEELRTGCYWSLKARASCSTANPTLAHRPPGLQNHQRADLWSKTTRPLRFGMVAIESSPATLTPCFCTTEGHRVHNS